MFEAPRRGSSPEAGGYGLPRCSVLVVARDRLARPVLFGRSRSRGVLRCARRCLRGIAGRRPCRPVCGERGKRPGGARRTLRGSGQAHRPLLPSGRGGGPVVVLGVTPHQGGGKAGRMAKGSSEHAARLDGRRSPVNTGASFPEPRSGAGAGTSLPAQAARVGICDAECRFRDVWNLVCDPATLVWPGRG